MNIREDTLIAPLTVALTLTVEKPIVLQLQSTQLILTLPNPLKHTMGQKPDQKILLYYTALSIK